MFRAIGDGEAADLNIAGKSGALFKCEESAAGNVARDEAVDFALVGFD